MAPQATVAGTSMAINRANNNQTQTPQNAKCQSTLLLHACNHTWTQPAEHQINCPGIPSGQKACNNMATHITERYIDEPCDSRYGPCVKLARARKAADHEAKLQEQRKQEQEALDKAEAKKAKEKERKQIETAKCNSATETEDNYKDRNSSILSTTSTLESVQRMMEQQRQNLQAQKLAISHLPATKGIQAKVQKLQLQRNREQGKKEQDAMLRGKYDGQDVEEEWEDIGVGVTTGVTSMGLDGEDWVMA
ncbi:hypothetical protein BDZ45DRAFT_762498 [Acephala macrosclerotiorum]|nr:hypothetical protein BDZ45DRAFT_762498 [Acephala macrosclerotiorum]